MSAKDEEETLGTTRVPEGSQSDSGDSMITSTSSKKNKSRPERERGPARKERKLRRAQAHREAQGLEGRRTDGTVCRVHSDRRPKEDTHLIFQ